MTCLVDMSYRLCWQNMTLQGFAILTVLGFWLVISVFYAFLFYVHYSLLYVVCFFFLFLFFFFSFYCVCFVICCRHGEIKFIYYLPSDL